jgi:hypothetical protein
MLTGRLVSVYLFAPNDFELTFAGLKGAEFQLIHFLSMVLNELTQKPLMLEPCLIRR